MTPPGQGSYGFHHRLSWRLVLKDVLFFIDIEVGCGARVCLR